MTFPGATIARGFRGPHDRGTANEEDASGREISERDAQRFMKITLTSAKRLTNCWTVGVSFFLNSSRLLK